MSTPAAPSATLTQQTVSEPADKSSAKRRSFFGFGKKKRDDSDTENSPESPVQESTPKIVSEKAPQLPELASVAPMSNSPPTTPGSVMTPPRARSPKSPIRSLHSSHAHSPVLSPWPTATSPSSPSPPRLSTSSSQIFERNVQEHANLAPPASAAIPAHIQTENHIPAVLEASSLALTNRDCDVDDVEIVMHSAHQPAVSVVAPHASVPTSPILDSTQSRDGAIDEAANGSDDVSFYGGAAANDKRRLSFVSFADIVQAEQEAMSENALHTHSTSSPSRGSPIQSATADPVNISSVTEARYRRSPSPIRLGTSPPQPIFFSGERSPRSPTKAGDTLGVERGELTIETLGHALRKTGSGDMGANGGTLIGDNSTLFGKVAPSSTTS